MKAKKKIELTLDELIERVGVCCKRPKNKRRYVAGDWKHWVYIDGRWSVAGRWAWA